MKNNMFTRLLLSLFNPFLMVDIMSFFATFDGNDGVVKVSTNTVAEVTEWSITETSETKDDTAMGDAWRTLKAGLKSFAGSLTCHWDDTDSTGQEALTVGAGVTLNLYPEGDSTGEDEMTGAVIITSVGVTVNKDGITQRSFSFEGNGALTHGTAS